MTRPKSSIAVERVHRAAHVDRVDGIDQTHPTESERRADSSLSSRHSRLADHLLVPEEDFDPARAAGLCAEVCRLTLEELVPGLLLIKAAHREQLQARVAYLLALFDFAGQPGMEGERLSQINRWEYNLEMALDGEPIGQPIFVHLANCYAQNPWSDRQFSRFGALARHRAASEEGLRGVALERWFLRLGRAIREQFLGEATAPELDPVLTAIARSHQLKSRVLLQLRRRDTPQAAASRPAFNPDNSVTQDEIAELQSELRAGLPLIKLAPKDYQKATRYAAKASLVSLNQCKIALKDPARRRGQLQLGIFSRMYLLLSSNLSS